MAQFEVVTDDLPTIRRSQVETPNNELPSSTKSNRADIETTGEIIKVDQKYTSGRLRGHFDSYDKKPDSKKLVLKDLKTNLLKKDNLIDRFRSNTICLQTQCKIKQEAFYSTLTSLNSVRSSFAPKSLILQNENKKISTQASTQQPKDDAFASNPFMRNTISQMTANIPKNKTQETVSRYTNKKNSVLNDFIVHERAIFENSNVSSEISSPKAFILDRYRVSQIGHNKQKSAGLWHEHKPQFLRRKLSPLGYLAQPTQKILHLANYQAYTELSGIVPAEQKMNALSQVEQTLKIDFLRKRDKSRNNQSLTVIDKTLNSSFQTSRAISRQQIEGEIPQQFLETPLFNSYANAPVESILTVDLANVTVVSPSQQQFETGTNSQKWINIQKSTVEKHDHKVRRQQKEEIEQQIREMELKIKERRRQNENLYKQYQLENQQLSRQLQISQSVTQLDQQQNQQLYHFSNLARDSSYVADEVHLLYHNRINQDLIADCERTKAFLDISQYSQIQLQSQIDRLKLANHQLKVKIKYCSEAIEVEQNAILQQSHNLFADFHHGKTKSITHTKSIAESASMSNLGQISKTANYIAKVEKINRQVSQMVSAKKPIDCGIQILTSCKEAFSNLARATLFIVDEVLQHQIKQNAKNRAVQNVKDVACGISDKVLAVYTKEEEYCAPCFVDIKQGYNIVFTQKLMSVPVFDDQECLIYVLQIETDFEQNVQESSFNVNQIKKSPKKNQKSSGRADSLIKQKRNYGWLRSDMIVCQIIALLGSNRLQIFLGNQQREQKKAVLQSSIEFIKQFMTLTSQKQVLRSIKHDLPKLLGFECANVYLVNEKGKNLFAISIDEEAEKRAKEQNQTFEADFIFNESQVVRFPYNMGVNGLAYQKDLITYFNHCEQTIFDTSKQYASLYSIGPTLIPVNQQKAFGKNIGYNNSFNSKSDNFLELEKITNLVIASIQDEEIIGQTLPVGTVQLYNKKMSDLSQFDFARIYYIRKLIGSSLIKCEYYTATLETVIGMKLNQTSLEQAEDIVETVILNGQEGSIGPLDSCVQSINDKFTLQVERLHEALSILQNQNAIEKRTIETGRKSSQTVHKK